MPYCRTSIATMKPSKTKWEAKDNFLSTASAFLDTDKAFPHALEALRSRILIVGRSSGVSVYYVVPGAVVVTSPHEISAAFCTRATLRTADEELDSIDALQSASTP